MRQRASLEHHKRSGHAPRRHATRDGGRLHFRGLATGGGCEQRVRERGKRGACPVAGGPTNLHQRFHDVQRRVARVLQTEAQQARRRARGFQGSSRSRRTRARRRPAARDHARCCSHRSGGCSGRGYSCGANRMRGAERRHKHAEHRRAVGRRALLIRRGGGDTPPALGVGRGVIAARGAGRGAGHGAERRAGAMRGLQKRQCFGQQSLRWRSSRQSEQRRALGGVLLSPNASSRPTPHTRTCASEPCRHHITCDARAHATRRTAIPNASARPHTSPPSPTTEHRCGAELPRRQKRHLH